MKYAALHLSVTDDCDFACSYCYRSVAGASMSERVAEIAVSAFVPRLRNGGCIVFYGGEPLLRFDLMKSVVERARFEARRAGRRVRFALTTNGNRAGEDVIAFLEENRFGVELSFDGSAQDVQRAAGSEARLRALIARLLERKRVRLETNSVFTCDSVGRLGETLEGIVDSGVSGAHYGLSYLRPWTEDAVAIFGRELARLRRAAVRRFKTTGTIPFVNFRLDAPSRIRYCSAGQDRVAVDPHGGIWGCAVLGDWARGPAGRGRGRCFKMGSIAVRGPEHFRSNIKLGSNYESLAQDRFSSPDGRCHSCPDVDHCWVCPVSAALAGGAPGRIPGFVCALQKVKAREARRFVAGSGWTK